MLDSLYFKTVDNNGVPIPVVQFTGYLEAGASVSIGILEVGVVGGIKLTVGFYWNDPNGDGKFRLFEFGAAVANNPICLFNVGGELSLYIKVFVVIGFSPFSVSFDFTLVNIKLLDFSFKPDCTPPPPRLGGTQGGVLYVFAGKFGGAGPRGNAAWDAKNEAAETWAIRQVPEFTDEQGDTHEAAVEVRGIGLTESFSDKDDAIKTVVVDGRAYTGNLTISFTGGSGTTANAKRGAFTKMAVVFTGSGDDVIRTGEGDSWVDSGAGADNITTLDRADLDLPLSEATARVAGGPGPDVITVGNGNDTVTGDGSIAVEQADRTVELAPDNASKPHNTSLVGALDVGSLKDSAMTNVDTAQVTSADGDDQIAAGLGAVHLSGNGGVDTIGTANDSPLADSDGVRAGSTGGSADKEALYRAHDSVLVGGAGGDILKSGSANDKVFTGSNAVIDEFGDGAGDDDVDGTDGDGIDRNTVDTGAGSDTVYGSNAHRLRDDALDARAEGQGVRRRRSRRAHRRSGLRRDLRRPGQRLRRGRASDGRRSRIRGGRARLGSPRRRPAGCRQQHQAPRRRHRQRPHLRLRRTVDDLRRHDQGRLRRAVGPGEQAAGRELGRR